MVLPQYYDDAVVCLPDITKAYKRIPHPCLLKRLVILKAAPRVYDIVSSMHVDSNSVYRDVRFWLRRGIKEGWPLYPLRRLACASQRAASIGSRTTSSSSLAMTASYIPTETLIG